MNSKPLLWCEETFGSIWDLDDTEIDPLWVDDEGTPWWTWCSNNQNYDFEFYFQHEEDAIMFMLVWKELHPIIIQWANN